jgi:hypothetical protein
MKTERIITVTRVRFENVMRALHESAYLYLDSLDQEVCDAYDRGLLRILDQEERRLSQ